MLGSKPPRDRSAGLIEPIARDGGNPLVPKNPSDDSPPMPQKTQSKCKQVHREFAETY
ncbi:MAG: hypothetical protein HW380_934 [Magnetococcales bacterium]|nr:hypothetical protein [Magnetococcales bacterium]